jgi:nucleoside phosphorylase
MAALIMGVCGALPNLSHGSELLLGDVIISKDLVWSILAASSQMS